MNSHLHVSGADILQYVEAKNRSLLAEFGSPAMSTEDILFLMNRAAMEGMKYGGNLALSAAHASLVMLRCAAPSSETD